MKLPLHYLITILLSSFCSADLSSEYDHFASLDEFGSYNLYWSAENEINEVAFAVEVRTTGWVAFGISSGNGMMKGSDLVIGWVKECKGYLTDRYADGYGVPILDRHQDYELTGFSEKDGTTILKFKRKIDTCDKRDRKITEGTTKVMFAYHSGDPRGPMDLTKHIVRGARTLMLLNSFKKKAPTNEMLRYFDLRIKETRIPPNDTTYWCHPVKLPEFDKKQHIVKFVPVIKNGNQGVVHHMLVYVCDHKRFNESSLQFSNDCYHPNMPNDMFRCYLGEIMASWAIGLREFSTPPDVGFPVGTDDSPKIVVLEIHYDNPKEKTDIVDDSGLRFFYTTPRKYDASIFCTGLKVSYYMTIPPKQENWTATGYCSKDCTAQGLLNTGLDGGGINVFAVILHTHLAGRKARLRHIRNGKELPEIARDDNYDFNFQEAQHLKNEVKVLPGDDLITQCVYNTMDRSQRTVGGFSTREEMCFSFMMYYPRTNLSFCATANHGYLLWLSKYGFIQNGTYVNKFPVEWNQTMAEDLKRFYELSQKFTAHCRINSNHKVGVMLKPKFVPLSKELENCSPLSKNRTLHLDPGASFCAVSGSKGLGPNILHSTLTLIVVVLIVT